MARACFGGWDSEVAGVLWLDCMRSPHPSSVWTTGSGGPPPDARPRARAAPRLQIRRKAVSLIPCLRKRMSLPSRESLLDDLPSFWIVAVGDTARIGSSHVSACGEVTDSAGLALRGQPRSPRRAIADDARTRARPHDARTISACKGLAEHTAGSVMRERQRPATAERPHASSTSGAFARSPIDRHRS
jgi:hypothetical protein